LKSALENKGVSNIQEAAVFEDFRAGDIKHSYANILKAQENLKYSPNLDLQAGLVETLDWYLKGLILRD
jgi:UDP-N-acetylglucosamine 4-epimerase